MRRTTGSAFRRSGLNSTEGGEMTRKPSLFSVVALIVVVAMIAAGAISAAASSDSGNQLAGTWSVTVVRPAPLPPVVSLQMFSSDGTVLDTSNDSPATRTVSFGSWERVEGHVYAASAVFLRFDPQTGAYIGTQKIDRTLRLSPDGQTFTHVGRATIYGLNGNQITSFRVTATGVRMPVDRIPDEP
jgi:hypothetical protein